MHNRALWLAAAVGIIRLLAPDAGTAQSGELRMLIANGVACRSEPEVDGAVADRRSVGEVIYAIDRAGDGEATWYLDRSRAPAGSTGCWFYGPLTVALDRSDPVPALLAAAEHILAREDAVPFAEYVAVDNVLTQMTAGAHGQPAIDASPLLQLRRLQVIERALDARDANRWSVARDPLKAAWMHAHADVARYFPPGGGWVMDAEVYWRLFEEHRGSDMAEAIAWTAAQGTVYGDECYASCHLEIIRRTWGRYWAELPDGAHVQEAVERAGEVAERAAETGCQYPEEAARVRELIGRLRSSLGPVAVSWKQGLLNHLDTIERACA